LFSNNKNKEVIILKIFIAGPRAVTELDKNVIMKLENIVKNDYNILLGDATGIDSSIQKFFVSKCYKNVTIFASNGKARNNYGNWKVEEVDVDNNITGFNFYVQKDLEMAKKSDIGFMIWNGESKGTFNNIINLLKMKKEVILYYLVDKRFYHFKEIQECISFLNVNIKLDNKLKKILYKNESMFTQICLF